MILINRQVNNHYSMGGTHFLQTGYLLLNRNAPHILLITETILTLLYKKNNLEFPQFYPQPNRFSDTVINNFQKLPKI